MQSLFLFTLTVSALFTITTAAPAPSPSVVPPNASRFQFYDIPKPLSGPCDLCEGTDGALWGQDLLVNDLFRIDPQTGQIQTFAIPFTMPPITNVSLVQVANRTAFGCAIRPGKDGNIYSAFGTRNQLVRINPKTKKIDVFTPDNLLQPVGNLQPLNDLYSAKDGIWYTQTTANIISFFSFATQKFTYYPVPTLGAVPVGMFVDSAGTPFFAEFVGQKLGTVDPQTGVITEYPVPVPALAGPAVIRAETQNRYIWFTATDANAMGRFDKVTKQFKAYPNPLAGGFPIEDTVDANSGVWFSSLEQNVLSRIDSVSGNIDQYVMPGTTVVAPVSTPVYVNIAVNYGPGNAIWFTNTLLNRVGRFSLS